MAGGGGKKSHLIFLVTSMLSSSFCFLFNVLLVKHDGLSPLPREFSRDREEGQK